MQAQCTFEGDDYFDYDAVHVWEWRSKKHHLETCYPDINEVDEENFMISLDSPSEVTAISIREELGVKFLPIKLFDVFADLVAFMVQNCSVTSVNDNHFYGLFDMQYLNLDGNKIAEIFKNAFADLTNLEYLTLRRNKIRSLGDKLFANLNTLEELYLSENDIHHLHPEVFSSQRSVKFFFMGTNKISSLDENVFENMANLKQISLRENKLEKIPKT